MCGIAGIVKLNPQAAVDEVGLKRMRDVLRHRGPDGEGLWIEGPVGLGMRRLAIVDVTGGHHPMANEDRPGIKPLYYAYTDKELLFASEIKALLVGGSVRPALNEAIVPEFLATGFVAGEETFFKGVRKLLPGRTLSWTLAEGSRERRYWRLPAATEEAPVTLAERAGELRTRLTAA